MSLSYTLSSRDATTLLEEISVAQSQGFEHFNFKVAVSPESDVLLARSIRKAVGQESFVWADANQGFHLHEARRAAEAFSEAGSIDLLEQPLPADQMQQMQMLRSHSSIALAVDEASVSPADFFHYAAEGLVDYLVVKITRSGGLWPSLQQIATAQAAGLPILVSGLTDGLLTKLAACQMTLAFGFDGPAALNGSQFIDESALYPEKRELEHGGCVHLGEQCGIGIQPDEVALQHRLVSELAD